MKITDYMAKEELAIQAGASNTEAKKFLTPPHIVKQNSNKSLRFPKGYVKLDDERDEERRGLGLHPVVVALKKATTKTTTPTH